MKNRLLFLFCVLLFQSGYAQLNCKTTVEASKSSVKKCLHSNKTVSTTETWDAEKRFGSLHIYSNQGKELAVYTLRSIGGHASAHVDYFPNGQVSKIEFSDAPDGGIQFYNSTRRFDEQGNQVDFYEMKHPYELETTFIQVDPQEKPNQPVEQPKNQEVIACATIFQTVYRVQNTTNSKLIITIQPLSNNAVSVQGKEIILEPDQSIAFDTITMADQFITAKVYEPTIKKVLTKKRNAKKMSILVPGPIDEGAIRTYYWFIVEQ